MEEYAALCVPGCCSSGPVLDSTEGTRIPLCVKCESLSHVTGKYIAQQGGPTKLGLLTLPALPFHPSKTITVDHSFFYSG